MKTILFLFLSLIQIQFCLADDYIIKKGDHYSNVLDLPSRYSGNSMKFQAVFDDSAIYDLNNINQFDINKLYGTTDCGSWGPTENSARFGWVWNLQKQKLEIWAFVHVKGDFFYELIDDADLNRAYDYELTLNDDHSQYVFHFNGKTVNMDRGCTDSEMSGWQLKPYFGGNEVAPHDILIKIEDETRSLATVKNIYPNPLLETQNLNVVLNLPQDASIGFLIYDLNGKLVREIQPVDYFSGESVTASPLNIQGLAGGMYLLVPYERKNGQDLHGFIIKQGRAMKFVVI